MTGRDMLDDIRLHAHLIGKPQSRRELNTPVLVLDRDALGRNVSKMAGLAKAAGVALRPHAKSHKSLAIARLQLDAGAIGLCCAKLGEAEVLASGGVESILITSPVVSAPAMTDIQLVGRYGIEPTWNDGHRMGIYDFEMLRRLCPCADCAG